MLGEVEKISRENENLKKQKDYQVSDNKQWKVSTFKPCLH